MEPLQVYAFRVDNPAHKYTYSPYSHPGAPLPASASLYASSLWTLLWCHMSGQALMRPLIARLFSLRPDLRMTFTFFNVVPCLKK